MTRRLNKYSSQITQPKAQAASQAMLHAIGLTEEDLTKPQVGIGSMWYESNPCNMHLLDLGLQVKEGVKAVGLLGMRFNAIGVSDGISMGTDGMSYSLPSRDLIADSIETMVGAHWYDALVTLPGCDKNMPGSIIAMLRLNRPALMIYGGTIRAGCSSGGEKLDVVSAFQSYGELLSKRIDDDQWTDIVRHACPGPGACGGMYTANTMATAIEVLGLSLPGSASTPAEDPKKIEECLAAGRAILNLLERDITPRQIATRKAFENAMVITMVLGGSTNAVLHLLAMARAARVDLSIDDFQKVSDRIPFLADLKPSGKYVMEDLHAIGGVPAVVRMLLKRGVLDGDCLTVTGRTLAENVAEFADLPPDQAILAPWEKPLKSCGHIRILRGSLAPEGAVAKITGKEGLRFSGPARVYDSEEDMIRAVEQNKVKKGDVIVIRYEGPQGGPGMPEMLAPTSVIMGAGLGKDVALITDGRFSGGSHGFIIGHVTPEAQAGGPIALVEDGDLITIDSEQNSIDVALSADEFTRRRARYIKRPFKAKSGALYRYIKTVKTASEGCVTDE
jgi:dihydroxy-acid dehydratase